MMDEVDELSVADLGAAQKRELKTLLGTNQVQDETMDPEDQQSDMNRSSSSTINYGKIDMKLSVNKKFDIK